MRFTLWSWYWSFAVALFQLSIMHLPSMRLPRVFSLVGSVRCQLLEYCCSLPKVSVVLVAQEALIGFWF